jgi:hypothetical protein
MPSFVTVSEQSATTTLQTIAHESSASNLLKSFRDHPLHFEKASEVVGTGIAGRYTPLNKPFKLENGAVHGRLNGLALNGPLSSSDESDEDKGEHVNGTSKTITTAPMDVISTEWPRDFRRPPGLRNFSNTCYMNSTLQALMHVPPLVSFFLPRGHTSNCISRRGADIRYQGSTKLCRMST